MITWKKSGSSLRFHTNVSLSISVSYLNHSIDGRNLANQLRLVVCPITRFCTSQVVWDFFQQYPPFPRRWLSSKLPGQCSWPTPWYSLVACCPVGYHRTTLYRSVVESIGRCNQSKWFLATFEVKWVLWGATARGLQDFREISGWTVPMCFFATGIELCSIKSRVKIVILSDSTEIWITVTVFFGPVEPAADNPY